MHATWQLLPSLAFPLPFSLLMLTLMLMLMLQLQLLHQLPHQEILLRINAVAAPVMLKERHNGLHRTAGFILGRGRRWLRWGCHGAGNGA